MRVLYLAPFDHSWGTESHVAAELEALGHEVRRVREPIYPHNETLDELSFLADEADLLLYTRGYGLVPEASELWGQLERRGVRTASLHLDVYVGLAREREVTRSNPFWSTGAVFTADGRPEAAEVFEREGVNHVWLPPAVYSAECASAMPGTFRPELAAAVAFIGSERYHPEWVHRPELIGQLARWYGDGFRLYGTPRLHGQALNDVLASTKVIVGDSCFAAPDARYFSDRPFECWGRGGYLVFPQIDALEAMVGPYPSWDVGEWSTLHGQIEDALADAFHRDGTVARLNAKVEAEHTYRDRMLTMLAALGLAQEVTT